MSISESCKFITPWERNAFFEDEKRLLIEISPEGDIKVTDEARTRIQTIQTALSIFANGLMNTKQEEYLSTKKETLIAAPLSLKKLCQAANYDIRDLQARAINHFTVEGKAFYGNFHTVPLAKVTSEDLKQELPKINAQIEEDTKLWELLKKVEEASKVINEQSNVDSETDNRVSASNDPPEYINSSITEILRKVAIVGSGILTTALSYYAFHQSQSRGCESGLNPLSY